MGFDPATLTAAATVAKVGASVVNTAAKVGSTVLQAATPAASTTTAAGAATAGSSVLGAVTTAAKLATAGLMLKTALSKPKTPALPIAPTPIGIPSPGQRKPAAELGGTSLVSSAFRPNTSGSKTLLGQ